MISWRSSSGRRAVIAALVVAALGGCHRGAPPGLAPGQEPAILVLFPVQNLSGEIVPTKRLGEELELELRDRGFEVAAGDIVERALAKKRIRYTGGLDRDGAEALRESLHADAVVIPSVETYRLAGPPSVALTVRVVSTGKDPRILWIDGATHGGDDAPGLLGLGRVTDVKELEQRSVAELMRAFGAWARGGPNRDSTCDGGKRVAPRASYRSRLLDDPERLSVAVLPFINLSDRRDAGDALVLHLVRQLANSGSFETVDPGVVRAELLGQRIILEGGISLDTARVVLEGIHADLLLAGTVRAYDDLSGSGGAPRVEFTAYLLDRRSGNLVWSSTSRAAGDDGVFFFGMGNTPTASALACRMSRSVVDGMLGHRPRKQMGRETPPGARLAHRADESSGPAL